MDRERLRIESSHGTERSIEPELSPPQLVTLLGDVEMRGPTQHLSAHSAGNGYYRPGRTPACGIWIGNGN